MKSDVVAYYWLIVLIVLVLVLPAIACNGGGDNTPTPQYEVTRIPQPTPDYSED